jgi:hypothetical protein
MPSDGVVFSDGVEADLFEFTSGPSLALGLHLSGRDWW